jgi:hypothetical protein
MTQSTAAPPTRVAFAAIPTRADVDRAGAQLSIFAPPRWRGEEGPRWRLTISPGSLQIGTKDYARLNRSQEEREARRLRDNPGMTLTVPKRAAISKWSDKSRTNMVRTFAAIDWQPFVDAVAGGACPALVTLTLPGDWLAVAPTGEAFKSIVNKWRRLYYRAWGTQMPGPWKMEFQRRGAPHLHILTVPPLGLSAGSQLPFKDWLSRSWAAAVNAPDPEERRKHELAGTGVDYEETLRYGDPKRIAVYFSKHGLFHDKEYQNLPPEAWSGPGNGPGRFWGVWVLDVAKVNVEFADNAHYVK